MAKIDLGNFGQSTIEVAPQPRTEVIGQAVQQLGGQVGQIGRQMAEQRFQQQAATASNNLLDHQLQNQQDVESIKDRLASGELQPEQGKPEYDKLAARNVLPSVDYLTPEAAASYNRGAQRVQAEGGFQIDALADTARKQRARDQASEGIDKTLKLAGSPLVPRDQKFAIEKQIDGYAASMIAAGTDPALSHQHAQNAKDQMWLDDAMQVAVANHDNVAGLEALRNDLTSGFYANGKEPLLDTNKRNALNLQVTNRIDTIHNRLDIEGQKRERDGEKAINEMQTQTATGVKPPPQKLAEWAQRTQGTPSSSDFADEVQHLDEVQKVLGKTVKEQVDYVRSLDQKNYTQGADVRTLRHTYQLTEAVKANATRMALNPLSWLEDRTGATFQPLDASQFLTPGGSEAMQAELKHRELELQTARAKDSQIGNMPLKPEEAAQLGSVVAAIPPDKAVGLFTHLWNASSPDMYKGMMAQIAPDNPVMALAGRRAIQDPQAATYIVSGESLIHPTKAQSGADGKPRTGLFVPTDESLQSAFNTWTGTAYRMHKDAAETDFQAVKAYYAGSAEHDGVQLEKTSLPNSDRVTAALKAVIGTVVDYNNKGQVIAPWGMDKSTFNQRVDNAWAVLQAKYPEIKGMSGAQTATVGLTNGDKEGQYKIPSGSGYLSVHTGDGKSVQQVVIDVNDPATVNYVPPKRTLAAPRAGTGASFRQ